MFVRYFVVSKRGSIGDYVSIPWGSIDAAREAAKHLAEDYPDCRFFICEAVEYAETVPVWHPEVDIVKLEDP